MSTSPATTTATIVAALLEVTGGILLGGLALTLSLSQRLSERGPVFRNFVFTWVLSAAVNSFDIMAKIAGKELSSEDTIRQGVVSIITLTSTFNFSLQLWYTLRETWHPTNVRTKEIRTFFLVLTPYLLGIIPVGFLFSKSKSTWKYFNWAISLGLCFATTILDIVLIVYYIRSIRKLKRANLEAELSLPFIFRLLGFGVYQLISQIITSLGLIVKPEAYAVAVEIRTAIFPLLAFCLLGLNKTILQIWFPWCFAWQKEKIVAETEETAELPLQQSHSRSKSHMVEDDRESLEPLSPRMRVEY